MSTKQTPSEFIVSKMTNFKAFLIGHPFFQIWRNELSFGNRVKLEALINSPLDAATIMIEYKKYLGEMAKMEPEKQPFNFYKKENKVMVVWNVEHKERVIQDVAQKLIDNTPIPDEELTITEEERKQTFVLGLNNDCNKILLYMNLLHEFFCKTQE